MSVYAIHPVTSCSEGNEWTIVLIQNSLHSDRPADRMAHVEESQTEGEGSPQILSLRSESSVNHADDGDVGPSVRRKRRRKREQRPESIIVYRSDVERGPTGDQGGEEEGAERSAEEGAKFLCTPTNEGELYCIFSVCQQQYYIIILIPLLIHIRMEVHKGKCEGGY